MWASAMVYSGVVIAVTGLVLTVRPRHRLRATSRSRALVIVAAGVLLTAIGLFLPASESRVSRAETRLDQFVPVWQFHEVHRSRIAVPPARVYEAIMRVRADEIALFQSLTWIRRGGRDAPRSILNPGGTESLIDVATTTGFLRLADDAPREVVIGTVVIAPPAVRRNLTPAIFLEPPPGVAVAAMNFIVTADGPDASIVSTETRVFANSAQARRAFAVYWRIIYPGSAIIRRMWLRAIERRAIQLPAASSRRVGRSRSARHNQRNAVSWPLVSAPGSW